MWEPNKNLPQINSEIILFLKVYTALKDVGLEDLHEYPNLKLYLITLRNYREEETRSWPNKLTKHNPEILPRKLDLDLSLV